MFKRIQSGQHAISLMLICTLIGVLSCRDGKRYLDEQTVAPQGRSMPDPVQELRDFRKQRDLDFRNGDKSPLSAEDRVRFAGLSYFSIDMNYRVTARLVKVPESKWLMMGRTDGSSEREEIFGVLEFELMGEKHSLQVYRNPQLALEPGYENYLFLPFRDMTNGESTYTGGRYMDLEIPEGDTLQLDFNKAYNPYCVYNSKYSCPLVPEENRLSIAVKAGERNWNSQEK